MRGRRADIIRVADYRSGLINDSTTRCFFKLICPDKDQPNDENRLSASNHHRL